MTFSRATLLCCLWCACKTVPAPAPRPPLTDQGRLDDPPPIAKVMEGRQDDPRHTLELLKVVWRHAVVERQPLLEAYALDRSGDLAMDLRRAYRGDEARLEDAGADGGLGPVTDACVRARSDYERAFAIAEKLQEPRLMGRIAHDLGWGLERCGDRGRAAVWYQKALDCRLQAGDALGVRYSANNLGVLWDGPKRQRLALYELALRAAQIAHDAVGERKTLTNIARLWFYSGDAAWLTRDWPDAGEPDDYRAPVLKGEVRQKFLASLRGALEAAARAGETPWDVCEGLQVEGDDCARWDGQNVEALFPEP